MTTADTHDLIARYYAAFDTGDRAAMMDCLSDDVVHDVNQGERRVGRDAFAAFLAHMDRSYDERIGDLVIFVADEGRRAAAEFTVTGTYKETDTGLPPATGQTYRLPAGAFFAVADGRIVRITTYYNLQDWLRQVDG